MKKDSKTKIASTYAFALYDAAVEKKAVVAVLQDVQKLIVVLESDAEILKSLANPIWKTESKKQALADVAQKMKISKETLSCLDVVADNGRFAELLLILQSFVQVYYQKNNIVEVEVVSVKNLSSSQDKKLKTNLEKMLKKDVIIKYEIAPEIMGGLRIKYASSMIDNTISGKLSRLENVMKGGQ